MPTRLVSPNELFTGGVEMMLQGNEPKNPEDWEKLVNFWAYNVSPEVLPQAVELLCSIFSVPIEPKLVQEISKHYKDAAIKRQEEMLKKIIGSPVTHAHLKHLRSIMAQNIGYDGLIAVFKKAGIDPSWPNHDAYEQWAKLCNALFMIKGDEYKEAQTSMAKIINGESLK